MQSHTSKHRTVADELRIAAPDTGKLPAPSWYVTLCPASRLAWITACQLRPPGFPVGSRVPERGGHVNPTGRDCRPRPGSIPDPIPSTWPLATDRSGTRTARKHAPPLMVDTMSLVLASSPFCGLIICQQKVLYFSLFYLRIIEPLVVSGIALKLSANPLLRYSAIEVITSFKITSSPIFSLLSDRGFYLRLKYCSKGPTHWG